MKLLIFDMDDTLFDSTNQIRDGKLNIKPFADTEEVLAMPDFTKILVTFEEVEGLQNRKIDKLGIRHYFDEIHISPNKEDKFKSFKEVIERHKTKNTIVIGNRIDDELRYGKQLGAHTVYFKHGKYSKLEPKDQYEIPDHTVMNMKELKDLLLNYPL